MSIFFKISLSLMTIIKCAFHIFTMSNTRLLDFTSLIFVMLDVKKIIFPPFFFYCPDLM